MLIAMILSIFQASAAVPAISSLELLSLPEANRIAIAKKNVKEYYPELMRMAFSEERSVPTRWRALILAATINQEGSIADVNRALKSNDWFMRNAALFALKSFSAERAQQAALQMLGDKALIVRSAAVAAISEHAGTDVREALWGELNASYNFRQNQGLWVRREIIEKLAQFPQRSEYSAFIEALRDLDKDLHSSAITGLEKLTKRHLGSTKSTVADREKLWTEYVKKNPVIRTY